MFDVNMAQLIINEKYIQMRMKFEHGQNSK